MQAVVGGVEVQHDPLRAARLPLDVEFDQQGIDCCAVQGDLLIACALSGLRRVNSNRLSVLLPAPA